MPSNDKGTQDLIETFVNRLVEEKEFPNTEQDVLEVIKRELTQKVEHHINAGLLTALPPEQMQKFDELLANGSDDEIQVFLKRYIPNMETVIAEILLDFKAAYLGV